MIFRRREKNYYIRILETIEVDSMWVNAKSKRQAMKKLAMVILNSSEYKYKKKSEFILKCDKK